MLYIKHTTIQNFGFGKIFENVFEGRLLQCLPRLHLLDKKKQNKKKNITAI